MSEYRFVPMGGTVIIIRDGKAERQMSRRLFDRISENLSSLSITGR